MVFKIDTFRSFTCMKILRWSFAYSAMVSDNSHLNWSFWFTIQKRLFLELGGFSSATSLGFYFVMFIYPFPASLLLIATGTGWGGITKKSGTDPPFLVVWASLQRHRFISLVFVRLSYFPKDLYFHLHYVHLILAQIWEKNFLKILSHLGAPFFSRVNNERVRRDLGTWP